MKRVRCPICGGLEFYMTNPPKCLVCTVWREKIESLQRFDVLTEYGHGHMSLLARGDYVKYEDVVAMFYITAPSPPTQGDQ